MRILIANHTLAEPAGSETYVMTLAYTLRSLGHDVVCFSPRLGRVAEELRRHGIPTVSDAREAGTVDVIHSSHLDSTHLALAAMPVTPVVFVQHGAGTRQVLERPPKPRRSIERWVAVSEFVAGAMAWRDGLPRDQIQVIPNFVDLESFAPLYPPRTPPLTVLLLSNFQTPDMRHLISDACQLAGMTPRFVGGNRSILDIRSELMVADIVVTIGRGAIEAMACGRPVVLLSAAGGDGLLTPATAAQALTHNYSGTMRRTVPSAKELADELRQATPALGEWGRKWVEEHHDARLLVPQLVAVYSQAITASQERLDREGLPAILASRYEEFYTALRWYYEVPASFDSKRAAITFPVWAPDVDDEIELLLERLRDEIVTWRRRYEWLVGYRPIGLALEAARFVRRSMSGWKRT
jgi:glycosyltransferase involved in cell wall biosynthesis